MPTHLFSFTHAQIRSPKVLTVSPLILSLDGEALEKVRNCDLREKAVFSNWSELVFPPSCSTRPKRAPLQGTPRCEPPPKERVGIFGEGCEILEYAPNVRRYSSFCQCFQGKVRESLERSLFPSLPLTEHSPPPFPLARDPLTVIISICYPTRCFFSGPLWPAFTIINHSH